MESGPPLPSPSPSRNAIANIAQKVAANGNPMQTKAASDAMAYDGVLADTLVLLVEA